MRCPLSVLIYTAIAMASIQQASTYGYHERNCGDIDAPAACSKGAITASGEEFDPTLPTAALAVHSGAIMRPVTVIMRVGSGPCVPIRVNDKMNAKWIGKRGFDLSPAALKALTGESSATWTGTVTLCGR